MDWLRKMFKEMASDFRLELGEGTIDRLASAGPFLGGVVVGVGTFALLQLVVTDPIHDALFAAHTVTVGEDGPEYENWWWSVLGNTFTGLTLLVCIGLAYVAGNISARRLQALNQSAAGRLVLAALGALSLIGIAALIFLPMLLVILDR